MDLEDCYKKGFIKKTKINFVRGKKIINSIFIMKRELKEVTLKSLDGV